MEIDYALVANPNFSHPGIVIMDMKVINYSYLVSLFPEEVTLSRVIRQENKVSVIVV